MLIAQAAPEVFFPPMYFWLFVLATLVIVFGGIATIVYVCVTAETQRQMHERETAARLIEVMIVQRKMSADEIEQVLNSYNRKGNLWQRISRWFPRPRDLPATGMFHGKAT
jgi:hypothetical protein